MRDEYPPAEIPPVPHVPGFEELTAGLQRLVDVIGPHLVKLTLEQRRALHRPTQEEEAFMDLLFEELTEHPELAPPGVDRERFMNAWTKRKAMSAIRDKLQEVEDMIEGRMLAVDPISRFQASDAVWSAMTHDPAPRPAQPDAPDAEPDDRA